jgi:RimJ/RimL family protein N-acetyltransferase
VLQKVETEYREITGEDFDALRDLGRMMHEEGSYSHLEFSDRRLFETFERYMNDPDRIGIIAMKGDKPCGMIGGYVSKYYFSDELVAGDIAWFVVPEYRGSRVGLHLLDAFENWAKAKKVSELRIGISTGVNMEAFDRLMKKRGYSMVGANYRLEN